MLSKRLTVRRFGQSGLVYRERSSTRGSTTAVVAVEPASGRWPADVGIHIPIIAYCASAKITMVDTTEKRHICLSDEPSRVPPNHDRHGRDRAGAADSVAGDCRLRAPRARAPD